MQNMGSDRSVYLNGNSNSERNGNNGNGNSGDRSNSLVYSMPLLNQTLSDDEGEGLDLRQLVNVVKHRLRLILGITLGVSTAVTIWTFLQQPKYHSGFQMLVEPVNKDNSNSSSENQLSILSQLGGDSLDYESQIEVLRSPNVLSPMLAKIAQQKYPEVNYKAFIYKGKEDESPLQITQLGETKILEISYEDTDPQKVKDVLHSLSQQYLQYSLKQRRREIEQGIQFVKQELPRVQQKVDDLQDKLQTFRQRNNLLDPQEQATQLARQHIAYQEKYFQSQVELNEAKTLYANLQRQLGLDPDRALSASYLSESPRYQKLLDELRQIEVQLAQDSVIYNASSPNMQALEEKRKNLLPLLEQESRRVLGTKETFGNRSDSVSSPSSVRLKLSQNYIQTTNQIQLLNLRLQAYDRAMNNLNRMVKQMPTIARQYTDLQRELLVANESLKRFLEAEETLQLQGAQEALPWQLISQPEKPTRPFYPVIPLNLALGVFGGLCLGIGAALLAERLDPVFHSTEELKEAIPLPLIGSIPVQKDLKPIEELEQERENESLPQLQIGNSKIAVETTVTKTKQEKHRYNRYNASPFLEAFRSLNTNIRLLGSDSPINSIVISSSIPSEGKSTISSHLAQAAAAMGQRVLLIDADLRRPQVHRWTGVSNERGLSNILATDLELEEAIQTSSHWENLSVLPAGDIPPDPTRLLSSNRMQQLMEQLKFQKRYDLIIYDTAPILGFADGRILAKSTNGVILVVKMDKTDRSVVKQNIDTLRVSNVPVLGLIANGVSRTSGDSYHYYSSYYNNRKS